MEEFVSFAAPPLATLEAAAAEGEWGQVVVEEGAGAAAAPGPPPKAVPAPSGGLAEAKAALGRAVALIEGAAGREE